MKRFTRQMLALTILCLPAAAFAGHSNLQVPPADTFLLGGDQAAAMTVTGKNVGRSAVLILSRTGGKDSEIATVPPGAKFEHRFAVGETALIRNTSATATARVSVDFTGSPSSLSMGYALPQKK